MVKIKMPANAYITVTLKKETVKKLLLECKNGISTSKAITDAIYEYVNSRKDSKIMYKTPDIAYLPPIGTTNCSFYYPIT